MVKYILAGIGWYLLLNTGVIVGVKLFGSDELVLEYFGGSRNTNTPMTIAAFALVFLGFSAIIGRLDEILRLNKASVEAPSDEQSH